jgi:hypothetical protein
MHHRKPRFPTRLIRDRTYDTSGSEITISAVPENSYSTLPLICAGGMLLIRRRK